MGIGLGIVLIVLGLILVLGAVQLPAAIDDAVASETLGWIFLVAGALSIVLALVVNRQRTQTAHVTRVEERHDHPER